jgi:hypothetical protein
MANPESTNKLRELFATEDEKKATVSPKAVVKTADYSTGKGAASALEEAFSGWTAPSIQENNTKRGQQRIADVMRPLEGTTGAVAEKVAIKKAEVDAAKPSFWDIEKKAVIGAFKHVVLPTLVPGYDIATKSQALAEPVKAGLNTETGKKIITTVTDKTGNLYSKEYAGLQAEYETLKKAPHIRSFAQLNATYDQAYKIAYAARIAERNDPTNPVYQQYLEGLGDSGIQSALGMILAAGATYVTRSPQVGIAVSAPFYSALSAGEQIQKKGEVYSLTNMAIDTVGDELLNSALLGIFKQPASLVYKTLLQSQVEGATEVAQSLLKYTNDYARAGSEQERAEVLADAKQYITSGDIAMEWAVGSTVGLIASGAGTMVENEQKLNYTRTSIQNSQVGKGADGGAEGMIAEGMPAEMFYQDQKAGILTEKFAQGRIDDVAQKLGKHDAKLEGVYRGLVDAKNTTYQNIIDTGLNVLNGQSAKNAQYVSQKNQDTNEKQALKKEAVKVERPTITNARDRVGAGVSVDQVGTAEFDQATEIVTDYANAFQQQTVFIPDVSGESASPIFEVSALPFNDGKIAIKFSANAGNTSIDVGYDYTRLYDSVEEATKAAQRKVVEWAKAEKTRNLDPIAQAKLDAVVDYATNPREPLSPAAIQRIADEGKAKKRAPKADEAPIATRSTARQETLDALRAANPDLFKKANKASTLDEFLALITKGEGELEDSTKQSLGDLYKKVKDETYVTQTRVTKKTEDAKAPEANDEKKEQTAEPKEQPTVSKTEQVDQVGYKSARATIVDLQKGKLTVAEYRKAYKDLLKNESKIKADLRDMPREELIKQVSRFTSTSKASKVTLANDRYDALIMSYALGKPVSFMVGEGSSDQAIQKIVDNATLEDLMAYKEKVAEQTQRYQDFVNETKRAITDPQTLEEFRTFIEVKGKDKFTAEQQARYDDLLAKRSKDAATKKVEDKGVVRGVKADTEMVIQETKHTKTGEAIFVVTMKDRVERDVYKELNARARKLGGYYSMFRVGGAIPGFQFKSRESAEQFTQVGKGETVVTDRFVQKAETQKESNTAKIRKVADSLEQKATEKLNAERKTNTARRASMASGMEAQAQMDIAMAKTMRNIADAIDAGGTLLLGNVTAKTQVEELDRIIKSAQHREAIATNAKLNDSGSRVLPAVTENTYQYIENFPPTFYYAQFAAKKGLEKKGYKRIAQKVLKNMNEQGHYKPSTMVAAEEYAEMADAVGEKNGIDTYKRLRTLGVTSTETLRSLLREYNNSQVETEAPDKVKQLERGLIGKKVGVDFFPTPKSVASQMVSEADIVGGMRVLEPSAGNGNIAEVIRDEAGVDPYVMEISGDLREVLEAKGFEVIGQDFMEENGRYDRIIMNPPFSNHQDIQHVRHAYSLLNPGGKVVAIMGEGAFFRTQKEDVAFREWLEIEVGGTSEKLPEGTFKDAELLANTGTNARIVTISKQAAPIEAQDPTGDYENSKAVQDARDNTLTIVVEDLDETIEASFGGFKRELIAEMNERITSTPEGVAAEKEHGEIVNFTIKKDQMKSIVFKDGFTADQNFKPFDVEREYKKAKELASKKVKLSTGTVSRPEQRVTKTSLKDILMGEERMEFTVGHDATGKYLHNVKWENIPLSERQAGEGERRLVSETRLKPSALGLVDTNLQEFQTVVLDASELKKKRAAVRAVDRSGNVMAEAIQPNMRTPDLKKYSASYLDYKPNGSSGKEHFIYAIPLDEREVFFGAVDGYKIDEKSGVSIKGSDDIEGEGIWHITATPFQQLIEGGAQYRGVASQDDLELILDNQEYMEENLTKELGRPLEVTYDQKAVQRVLKNDDEIREARMRGQNTLPPRDTIGRFTAEKERLAVSAQASHEWEEVSKRVQRAEPEGQKPSILLNREPSTPSELTGASQIDEKILSDPKHPEWKDQSEALVRRQEIARVLAEKLNMTVRHGKFRQKATGVYKPDQNVVRLSKKSFSPRVGGQLTTLFHETGHFIDFTVHRFRRMIPKTEVAPLLAEYGGGFDSVPLAKRRSEAFAEFVRLYLTQPEKAQKTAPQFHKLFEETMQAYPEVHDALVEARNSFTRWKDQPAAAKVLSQISFEQKDPRTLRKRMSYRLHQFYQHAVDDLHPLEQFVETATKGKDIATELDPYKLARNLRGWIGRANTFLEFGTIGRNYWQDGKVVYKGKSLKDILQKTDDAGALPDLSTYLVSKRTIALAERDIQSGITVKDAQDTIRELEQKYPDFVTVAKEIEKYQDQVMEYVIQSGLIKASDANAMKQANRDYVPFFRVVQELEQGGYMGGKGIPNTKNLFKKIKGSELEIIDPIESIVKNTYALINAAERNTVLLTMAMMAEKNKDVGPLFERVPGDMSLAAKVNAKDIVYQALGATSDMAKMFLPVDTQIAVEQHVPDSMVNIFRPSMFQKGNVVTVMDAGVAKQYVAEEDLYKALNAMEVEDVAMFIKILSYPAQFLRAGATLTPEFMLRNPARDTFSAAIYSRHGFTPVWDTLRGFAELIKKGDVYHAWLIEGGELASIVSQDRESMRQNHKELMQRSERIKKFIKNPLEVLRLISAYSEQATRLGEARLALARGKSPQEAAYASREVTLDFMRSGAKMRTLNKLAAFFNAVVQGDDKMVRAFKTNPARTSAKTLLGITMPSIILYMLNRDEDGWDEIPQWQKDLFWLVKVDGTWYRIPKPFELGLLFGSLPERMLEYMYKKDPESMREVAHTIIQGTMPGFMPTAMTPIVENITNYSFFLDRPIVSQGMTNLLPEEQYTQNTSEIAKITGKMLGYSPAKIENLVRGYFAGLGTYAMQATDKVLEGTGIIPKFEKPTATGADMVGLKAFVVRDPVGSSGVSVDRFYKKRDEAVKAYNHVKDLAEAGKKEQAREYLRDNPEARLHSEYEALARTLSEIRKKRKEIYESDTLTGDEKREKIQKLDNLSTDVAQKGLTMKLK